MADFVEEIVAERVVFRGRKLAVAERDIRVAEGQVVTREILKKDDSVAVLALDAEGRVHLVEEYFAGTGERALCLPKGSVDPGEDPADAALRELREELGLRGDLEPLCTLNVSPGYLSQRTRIYVARRLVRDPLPGDEVHSLKPVVVGLDEAIRLCEDGVVQEARTVAALLLARSREPG
ncbi:NUDIX domain-containing protein [Actinomadura sp. 9N215]|uniref:NUDIX domain-containing protein n=1 Tax=Actinomadura sp. 9N215 TaxID=3375150 RepID=UPI0037A5629A